MCPGSHIRRASGGDPARESPDVQVPDGPTVFGGRGRLAQGASNPWGRSMKRTLQRRYADPPRAPHGECSRPAVEMGAPSPSGMGEGQRLRGRNRTRAPAGLPGVGAAAPGEGSVAQSGEGLRPSQDAAAWRWARRITARTGSRREGRRLAAEAVGATTARTTQPRPSKGPLGERGRRRGKGQA